MKLNLKQKVVNSTRQEKLFVQAEGELTPSSIRSDRALENQKLRLTTNPQVSSYLRS